MIRVSYFVGFKVIKQAELTFLSHFLLSFASSNFKLNDSLSIKLSSFTYRIVQLIIKFFEIKYKQGVTLANMNRNSEKKQVVIIIYITKE